MTEGRLDPHGHEIRSRHALRARTADELTALTADLPARRRWSHCGRQGGVTQPNALVAHTLAEGAGN
ncbi:DUF1707 SHOCT-like domain-containing protein [Streptomyces coeruleorubidus]|uniref:DUF1707 SHOCT-like domain-containing protein n=1 Tax=Streptomyces coeruleorubidus TaxID=116188 RepID=UPI003F538C01